MTEKQQQFNAFLRLLLICICASLYAWGGMEMKFLRRFVAPVLCGAGMFYFSRDWRSLLQACLMGATLRLGYGADIFWLKVAKRGVFGLTNGLSGSTLNFFRKNWLLVGLQCFLLITAFIVIGVFSPLPNARIEELFLGFLVFAIPIFSARERT